MYNRYKMAVCIVLILALVMGGVAPEISYADKAFSDVPDGHWVKPILLELADAEIIQTQSQFGLGLPIERGAFNRLIAKVTNNQSGISAVDISKEAPLTRDEGVQWILSALGFGGLKQSETRRFIDTKDDIPEIALDFGIVNIGYSKRFRPKDVLTREEAHAMIYNVYTLQQRPIETMHGYYAISSYGQAPYARSMDVLSFGWSRLEYNVDKTGVLLNSTASNRNEYRVPVGYRAALEATTFPKTKRFLMVTSDTTLENDLSENAVTFMLAESTRMDEVIQMIVTAVTKSPYGIDYDGVTLDFEALKGEDSARKYTQFIQKLRRKLPVGYPIFVAVHPYRSAQKGDFYDGYDLETMEPYVDKIIIMAHDYYPKRLTALEMKSGYSITPLSPIDEVYTAAAAAKRSVKNPSKILIQISMDTVLWKVRAGEIVNERPYHPSYAMISEYISEGAKSEYSQNLQSPYMVFESKEDGMRNILWYENVKSVKTKMDLVRYMGLGGISVWRLGLIPNGPDLELGIWEALRHR